MWHGYMHNINLKLHRATIINACTRGGAMVLLYDKHLIQLGTERLVNGNNFSEDVIFIPSGWN